MCVCEPPEYPPRGGSSAVDVLGGRRVGSILAVNLHHMSVQRSTAAWPLTQPVLTAGQVTGSGVCPWLPWAFPPGPPTGLQRRCWAGLWARQGASELGAVGVASPRCLSPGLRASASCRRLQPTLPCFPEDLFPLASQGGSRSMLTYIELTPHPPRTQGQGR